MKRDNIGFLIHGMPTSLYPLMPDDEFNRRILELTTQEEFDELIRKAREMQAQNDDAHGRRPD